LKFTAFELGGVLESCRDILETFEILSIRSLAPRGRRAGAAPAKFRRGKRWGVEEEWSLGALGGGVPTAAEAAARRSLSMRSFPARKVAKLGSDSCSRRRGSYRSGWIGWRKGGRTGSTRTEAHRRGGSDGEVVPMAGVPEGGEEAAGKLLRNDVVLLVLLAGRRGSVAVSRQ
jgi:hypothetical protein